MSKAYRWNIPTRPPRPTWTQLYFPVPESGLARCLEHNGHGFQVGQVYRFQATVYGEKFPPYDVVVVYNDDYEQGDSATWVFLNDHMNLFRKSFEIV